MGDAMLGETDGLSMVDRTKAKRFLRWIEESPNAAKMANFEKVLNGTDNAALPTFVTGMRAIAGKLSEMDENPFNRIMSNPAFLFQTGLLLGYAMSLATGDPGFDAMISELEARTKNVTPITAAKGLKK